LNAIIPPQAGISTTLASEHPYEQLTPDTVIDAVESAGYLSDARILALNSYENRVYQVGIEAVDTEKVAPLIAKFYRPARWSNEQILEEHRFVQELHDLEIPSVPPLKDAHGNTLHTFKDFRFALYPRQGGHAPELDNLDSLLILGRFIGRMHAVGQTKPFQYRNTLTLENFGHNSMRFLLENNFLPSSLRASYEAICKPLLTRITTIFSEVKASNIRLHGDCHPGNVLWRNDTPHFVDFDDCMNGPAMQDLWMLLSGDRPTRLAQLAEIIDGYREFCDFAPRELRLIESLRTLRLMHYAAWLARRWSDPAFPLNFPWFNTERYWGQHILELKEQLTALDEAPLTLS